MYKGKISYFYNGELLYDVENQEYLIYSEEERRHEIIPPVTFSCCRNVKTIIMADESVQRIEYQAFYNCTRLVYVKLSRNLQFIGEYAFSHCHSLPSLFIPPSCQEICGGTFCDCYDLIILRVPQNTELGDYAIDGDTKLLKICPFEIDEINEWIKNMNHSEEFTLHRECASFELSEDKIYEILKERGLSSFKMGNKIGITAARYLEENPFSEIDEQKFINRVVLDLTKEAGA